MAVVEWFRKLSGRQRPIGHVPDTASPAFDPAGLTLKDGLTYKGGYTDDDVLQQGKDAGQHDWPRDSVWGKKNAELARARFDRMLDAAFRTLIQLVGTRLVSMQLPIRQGLGKLTTRISGQRHVLIDVIEAWAEAERWLEERKQQIRSAGLYVPHRVLLWILVAALLGLFGADFTMLPLSFSVLDLSDKTALGIPFLDELHLATTGVLFGLIVAAHRGAAEARTILSERQLERHTPRDKRSDLPAKDADARRLLALSALAGLLLLTGVTVLRASYLHSQDQPAQIAPFLLINVGIYIAAFTASLWFAHPLAKEYRADARRARDTRKNQRKAYAVFGDLIAGFNSQLELYNANMARAVQHVLAGVSDTGRQKLLYELGVLHGIVEPTDELLFDASRKELTAPKLEELLKLLLGIQSTREFVVLDTSAEDKLINDRRGEILELRAHFNAKGAAVTGGNSERSADERPPEPNGVVPSGVLPDEVAKKGRSKRRAPKAADVNGNGGTPS
jgi:hypothetical protein